MKLNNYTLANLFQTYAFETQFSKRRIPIWHLAEKVPDEKSTQVYLKMSRKLKLLICSKKFVMEILCKLLITTRILY